MRSLLPFASVLLLLCGCGREHAPPLQDPGAPAADPGSPDPSIAWNPCSIGVSGAVAECAEITAPLDHADPGNKSISLFVKRVRAPATSRRGQIWLLQGGPGASGETLEGLVPLIASVAPHLDILIPDHRGVGRSTRLACPDALPETDDWSQYEPALAACRDALIATWGSGLAAFSATQAGRDLAMLIDRTRPPGQDVFVWGVSYGTFWAQRYLGAAPAQPTGVVLDSVVHASESFWGFDLGTDGAAARLFAECAKDTTCREKLGDDPWQSVADVLSAVQGGHCPTKYDLGVDGYRSLFAEVLMLDFWSRALLPSLVARVKRCSPGDLADIERFADALADADADLEAHFSLPLYLNVAFGDLTKEPPPSLGELATESSKLRVATTSVEWMRRSWDIWPHDARDALRGTYPTTTRPVLLMNGTLDAQTVIENALLARPHYTAPSQSFVVVERAAHGVIAGSPLASQGSFCGANLLGAFIKNPGPVDASCATAVIPVPFDGAFFAADAWLDQADAWSDLALRVAGRASFSRAFEPTWRRVRRMRRLPAKTPPG